MRKYLNTLVIIFTLGTAFSHRIGFIPKVIVEAIELDTIHYKTDNVIITPRIAFFILKKYEGENTYFSWCFWLLLLLRCDEFLYASFVLSIVKGIGECHHAALSPLLTLNFYLLIMKAYDRKKMFNVSVVSIFGGQVFTKTCLLTERPCTCHRSFNEPFIYE